MEIKFRQITDEDLPFLKKVYHSTREDELQVTGWTDNQKDAFIEQQFLAQHAFYQEAYYDASFEIILIDRKDAGRLYLWESDSQIRIVDISLLPEFRNLGAGGIILNSVIKKSEESGKVLSIHVECYNKALSLYNRKGFVIKDNTGVYYYMEREPSK